MSDAAANDGQPRPVDRRLCVTCQLRAPMPGDSSGRCEDCLADVFERSAWRGNEFNVFRQRGKPHRRKLY